MRLPHRPQHDLVGLGVVLHPQRRVLRGEPGQPLAELVLVGLRPRLDRDRQQRLGHRPGPQHQRLLRVGQRVAGLGPAEPPDRAEVAGDDQVGVPQGLAERHRQRPDPLVLVVVLVTSRAGGRVRAVPERVQVPRDVHGRVRPQRAGEHPHQADPSDVRVAGGLDHLRDQRAVRVAGQRGSAAARRREHLGERVLGRRGEPGHDEVQQLARADPGGGVHGYDGVERAARDRPLEVLDQQRRVDDLPAEVALHQRLVLGLLDDALDQPAALLVVRRGPRRPGDQPDEAALLAQVDRQHPVAERLPEPGQHPVVVGPRVVELGDHHDPGHAPRRRTRATASGSARRRPRWRRSRTSRSRRHAARRAARPRSRRSRGCRAG